MTKCPTCGAELQQLRGFNRVKACGLCGAPVKGYQAYTGGLALCLECRYRLSSAHADREEIVKRRPRNFRKHQIKSKE